MARIVTWLTAVGGCLLFVWGGLTIFAFSRFSSEVSDLDRAFGETATSRSDRKQNGLATGIAQMVGGGVLMLVSRFDQRNRKREPEES